MPFTVWASSRDVPGVVCSDARLGGLDPESRVPSRRHVGDGLPPLYPGGIVDDRPGGSGQGGWDRGISFSSLEDLARALSGHPFTAGSVSRLAINVHGLSGLLLVDGDGREGLTADNCYRPPFRTSVDKIGLATRRDAVILFMGCLAGQGPEGTRLLKQLSKSWPGRQVVAFTTVGFAPAGMMHRAGAGCTEPGMRDTDVEYAGFGPGANDPTTRRLGEMWPNLQAMPWASERSPHAKIALRGLIVRGGP